MSKKLRQVTFEEALALTCEGVKVYAFDLTSDKLSIKYFSRLEIADAVNREYSYFTVEEVNG